MTSNRGGAHPFDIDEAVVAMRFTQLIEHVNATELPGERRFRRAALERAFLAADPGAFTTQERDAALALGVPQASIDGLLASEIPTHAVHVPLVAASGTAFVRLMHVSYDMSGHGVRSFDAVAERAAQDAFGRAADRMTPDRTHRPLFTTVHPEALSTTKGTLAIDGPSFGAAAFVSAYSLWSGRAVRAGTVITGRIVGNRVVEVGGLEAKLDAAASSRHDLKSLIVPADSLRALKRRLARTTSSVTLHGVDTLDELLDAALEPTSRAIGDIRYRVIELRRDFELGWRGFRWYALREKAERVLAQVPAHRADLRVEVLGMLGAAQEHVGSPFTAAQLHDEAAGLAESDATRDWVPDSARARLYQHQSMTLLRLGRLAEARAAAQLSVAAAKRAKLRDETYKAYGCLALVEIGARRGAAAVAAATQAIELVHAHTPGSCARTHGYLIEALGHAGDLDAVNAEFGVALEHLLARPGGDGRDHYEPWLRQSHAAALAVLGRSKDVIATLDVPITRKPIERTLLPGLLLRRYLGVALTEQKRADEGYTLLADSADAYGIVLEPNLALTAQLNVLYEARARLRNGDWNSDAQGRALRALTAVPSYLRDEAIVNARRRAERALAQAGKRSQPAVEALDRLLSLCTRIA